MVFTYSATPHSSLSPLIYVGKDKYENDELLKVASPTDLWFHADRYSSAHVYLHLPSSASTSLHSSVPECWLTECSQLVREGSREGSQHKDITVIYTTCSNLRKTADMDPGTVAFVNPNAIRRVHVRGRVRKVLDQLDASKKECTLKELQSILSPAISKATGKKTGSGSDKNSNERIAGGSDFYADVFGEDKECSNNRNVEGRSVAEIEESFFD